MILKGLPETSAFRRGVLGEQALWGLPEHLLAVIVDALAVANWQRGGDENAKKPEQVKRPGVEKQIDGQVIAQGQAVPIEDMNALLGW